jgi:hypothetical protein
MAIRYGANVVLQGELLDPDAPRDERRVRFKRSYDGIDA